MINYLIETITIPIWLWLTLLFFLGGAISTWVMLIIKSIRGVKCGKHYDFEGERVMQPSDDDSIWEDTYNN